MQHTDVIMTDNERMLSAQGLWTCYMFCHIHWLTIQFTSLNIFTAPNHLRALHPENTQILQSLIWFSKYNLIKSKLYTSSVQLIGIHAESSSSSNAFQLSPKLTQSQVIQTQSLTNSTDCIKYALQCNPPFEQVWGDRRAKNKQRTKKNPSRTRLRDLHHLPWQVEGLRWGKRGYNNDIYIEKEYTCHQSISCVKRKRLKSSLEGRDGFCFPNTNWEPVLQGSEGPASHSTPRNSTHLK